LLSEVKLLHAKLAAAQAEIEALRNRLRETAQILIAEVGAPGPMSAEDAARAAVARMELLQRLADESAHEAGLYARRMGQAQLACNDALKQLVDMRAGGAE
jgi:hypothetical protein